MVAHAADKAALRRFLLSRRDALAPVQRIESSDAITRHLLDLPAFSSAKAILAYLSFGSEFDTQVFVDALRAQGKQLILPRVDRGNRRLELFRVSDLLAQTAAGTWGIREPIPERSVSASRTEASLVLVPGVGFTPHGDRLGYGGGFYDRLLASWPGRPLVVAAAFAVQIVGSLPMGPNDVRIDAVVTEDGWLEPSTLIGGQSK
jgi:5-formyltetrahydrofolate cyclo-ligase